MESDRKRQRIYSPAQVEVKQEESPPAHHDVKKEPGIASPHSISADSEGQQPGACLRVELAHLMDLFTVTSLVQYQPLHLFPFASSDILCAHRLCRSTIWREEATMRRLYDAQYSEGSRSFLPTKAKIDDCTSCQLLARRRARISEF